MNSSISSSRKGIGTYAGPVAGAGRRWAVILLLLLATITGLEAFTRIKLLRMSKDFVRFDSYRGLAESLVKSENLRVALIGNSATQRGVDLGTLRQSLSGGSLGSVDVEMFVADQSRINTWQFMLERYFFHPRRRPDLFVVTFYGDDLADGNYVEIGRLAQFFTTRRDWPDVFALDLPDMSQQADFVVSSAWATFAARDRIKERIFDSIIPGYKPYVQKVNAVSFHAERSAAALVEKRPSTYRALERLLRRAHEEGAQICFVAFPTREPGKDLPYDLDDETLRRIRNAGMDFLDLRRVDGLRPDLYDDDVHLAVAGRPIYSRHLAEKLAPILSQALTAHRTDAPRNPQALRP